MPSIPPYFRAMYPEQARDIDQGYQDMGRYMTNFFKGMIKRLNPFRTP
jgi:hypothetical protein